MVWKEFLLALKIVWERALEIVRQVQVNKEMLWILLPLLAAMFLLELYFSRYKKEELGWNSALANSLVLFFVGLNLCSFLYNPDPSKNMLYGFGSIKPELMEEAIKKSAIAFFIVFESVLLMLLDFFHLVSKRFAFGISSGLVLNFIGAISIILVRSDVKIDLITIPAVLLLFAFTVAFFSLLRLIFPSTEESEESEETETKAESK